MYILVICVVVKTESAALDNIGWYNKLTYDLAIPFLGIYPEITFLEKDTCTPMFTAALFTIAKTWKWPKYPSTGEWLTKMWYVYIHIYIYIHTLCSHEKGQHNAICSNMDGTRDLPTK